MNRFFSQNAIRILIILFAQTALLFAQSNDANRALNWLHSQMKFDIDPGQGVAKLVKSYETNSIIGAWTYDQALSIIAFSAAGDDSSAKLVLDALRLKQAADGSWDFAYAYNTGAQLDTRIPVGTNAWALIAIAQYELITGDGSYRDMALKNANWLLRFRNKNTNQESYGAFVMGPDHHSTTWDESTVYSTEHNVDAYAAMRLLYELTGETQYMSYADDIYQYLITEIWNPSPDSNDSFGASPPLFWVGFVDYTKYLDPQSWTVAAIGATGPNGEDFTEALDWAYDNLRVANAAVNGVTDIQGFDVNASFDLPIDKVWSEGSEGMVTAYFSTGDSVKAVLFHEQTKRYQSANGGVPYATKNPDGWVSYNSVAGTAWFVFNELRINPFQGMKKIGTSVKDKKSDAASVNPEGFRLEDIYPNPSPGNAASSLSIRYSMASAGEVELSVYNLLGQQIKTLQKGYSASGEHVSVWDRRDQRGNPLRAGLYFIVLELERIRIIRKLILL